MKLILGVPADEIMKRLYAAAEQLETIQVRMSYEDQAWLTTDFALLSAYKDEEVVILDGDTGESVQIPVSNAHISYKHGVPSAITIGRGDLEFCIEFIDELELNPD